MRVLLCQQVKREARSLFIWCLVIAALVFFEMGIWESLRASGSLDMLEKVMKNAPPEIRQLYPVVALTTPEGWLAVAAYGRWIDIPFLIFTGLFVAGIVTREMDRRTLVFLLALPVARWQILVVRWIVFAAALAMLHAARTCAAAAGLRFIGQEVEGSRLLAVELNSVLLYLALGSLLLAMSLFFYIFAAETKGLPARLREALPFSFYDPGTILLGGEIPVAHYLILGILAIAFLLVAIFLFQRKPVAV